MNARSDAQHAGFPMSLISISIRQLALLTLLALTASASPVGVRLPVPGQPAPVQDFVQLGSGHEHNGPPSKTAKRQHSRRRRRSHAIHEFDQGGVGEFTSTDAKPVLGNSFIQSRSPVHKVVVLPPNAEDVESAAQVHAHNVEGGVRAVAFTLPHAVSDSAGMRVAHLESKTLNDLPASKDVSTRRWWLEVVPHNTLGGFVTSLTGAVLIYAAYNAVRSWRHRRTLLRVQAKVHRVNEVFLGLHSDLSLCLCCVEFLPNASPSTVTFLCGHSFHMSCVNDWYRRHSRDCEEGVSSACLFGCPICAGSPSLLGRQGSQPQPQICKGECAPVASTVAEASGTPTETSGGSVKTADCARLFALHGLCERYPGIVSKDDTERLASQPTAVLQSEIQFARHGPRSNSNFILK